MNDPILGFNGEYRFLSNFWPSPVYLYKVKYDYVEEAYQAAKCVNPADRKLFHSGPFAAKKLSHKIATKPNWHDINLHVMENLVRQKWLQKDLLKLLLSTGDSYIEETNYWHDSYYGVCTCLKCKNIEGRNHLGKLHMKIRSELSNFGMCVFGVLNE